MFVSGLLHKALVQLTDLLLSLCGAAVILRGMASILSNMPDILHVQHHFLKLLGAFQREKYTFPISG